MSSLAVIVSSSNSLDDVVSVSLRAECHHLVGAATHPWHTRILRIRVAEGELCYAACVCISESVDGDRPSRVTRKSKKTTHGILSRKRRASMA